MVIGAAKKPSTRHDPMADIHKRLDEHDDRFESVEARMVAVENVAVDMGDIADTVNKIFRYLKVAAPSIISAAVAAGIVNGKVAEFIKVLFGGG